MYHNRWPLAQAHAHVLSRRAVIKPNVGFWNQLCDWERELKLGPGTTPHPDSIVTPKFGSIVIGKVQLSEAEQKAAEEKYVPIPIPILYPHCNRHRLMLYW